MLLVDLDPQGHCALGLSVPAGSVERQVGDLLLSDLSRGPDLSDALWQVGDRFDLIPSDVRLAALEATQGPVGRMSDRDRRLEQLLSYLTGRYDWIVIDCPPHIGLLTFNALRACTEILAPVEASYFSLQGAEHLLRTVETVGRRLGRRLESVLLPTMFDDQVRLGQEIQRELRKRYSTIVADQPIRFCQAVREAAGFGRPVNEYAPESKGAQDYAALAKWLDERRPGQGWGGASEAANQLDARLGRTTVAKNYYESGSSSSGIEQARPVPVVETPGSGSWPRLRSEAGDRAAELARRARTFSKDRREINRLTELGQSLSRDDEVRPGMTRFSYRPLGPVSQVLVILASADDEITRHNLEYDSSTQVYVGHVALEPGTYRYRLIVDGSPMIDPQNPICESDEQGQMYSMLTVRARTAQGAGPALLQRRG